MSAQQAELFGAEAIEEAQGPRWVIEVNEAHLYSYGDPAGGTWWIQYRDKPGIVARATVLAVGPPGELLYLACDDQEEAKGMAEWMHSHGCSPKAVKVQRIGHLITCQGCEERRPLWRSSPRVGNKCRPCYEAWLERPL